MNPKVLVAVAEGSEEIEAVCLIDVLRRAGCDVTVATVSGDLVTMSRKVLLKADRRIGECAAERWDLVALPGGMPGAEHLRDSLPLTKILEEQAGSGRLYAAICASPVVVLDHHGLLEGKRATCYPGFTFKNGSVLDESVVVDGNCVTSRGPGTAIDFALKLAGLLVGEEKAASVRKGMIAE